MKFKTKRSTVNLYFSTSVITGHKRIFDDDELARIVLRSLHWLRENQFWKLFAYCLMPNHLHCVAQTEDISKVLAKFHSFTGHEIIKYLQKNNRKDLQAYFANAAKTKKQDRTHLVWEDPLVRIIESEYVLMELIEYVHNNPIAKGWRLAISRSEYPYSSARYYEKGLDPVIPIDDAAELLGG